MTDAVPFSCAQLNSTALCRNIIRGIGAADLPPLESFPLAHRVTYQYYMAVFAFLREDYAEAERRFREALEQCHYRMKRNIECVTGLLVKPFHASFCFWRKAGANEL